MRIQLVTGGDVAPMRDNSQGMFGQVGRLFQDADISFVNLEHALSTSGELSPGRQFFHRGPPASAEGLVEIGLSCVNLANNHVMDYGEPSLLETMDLLKYHRLPYFGAGVDLDMARAPSVVNANGLAVGFLGYSTTLPRGFAANPGKSGVNPLYCSTAYQSRLDATEYPGLAPEVLTWTGQESLDRLREDVAALKPRSDVILVYVHWGVSMNSNVHQYQREIGYAAIAAGAHAVFGGHQHVLSSIEFHDGVPIIYGTGNLLFDKWEPFFSSEARKSAIVVADLSPGQVRNVRLLPVRTGVGEPPELLGRNSPLWNEVCADIQRLSVEFDTAIVATSDGIEVSPP
jgi:poly-gamma-glutamate capsule biosynthesis protein CapA/YwtB (metallophosphatase superfamily)